MHRIEREKGVGVQPPLARSHSKTTDLSERGHVQVLGLPLSGLPPSPTLVYAFPQRRKRGRECVCVCTRVSSSHLAPIFSPFLCLLLSLSPFLCFNSWTWENMTLNACSDDGFVRKLTKTGSRSNVLLNDMHIHSNVFYIFNDNSLPN